MVRSAEKSFDPRALEARVNADWKENGTIEKVRKHRKGGKPWYFLDGPPYATGHIHIGTARNKILKDVYVRQSRMTGLDVRDQPGYDMHGLPIEVKVEKELGFNSKKEIESYGIDRFVEACRKFAVDHLAMMNVEFEELGVWLDWARPYRTIDDSYIEGAWWAIEKAHQRGLVFRSERVLTWCWRCETALANAEIEHEEREDPSAFVKLALQGKTDEFLVIWTTTPWTLPANVAVAVNPEIPYSKIRVRKEGREEILYVATAQAENVARIGRYEDMSVLANVTGADLEGLRYDHPFADEVPYHRTAASAWNNRVILGKHVEADRTGLVHTATGHGVEDFEAGRRYGVPVFSPVGEDGRYTDEAGAFRGLTVKSSAAVSPADEAVLARLREKGLLLASRNEKHSYGHCWRCKNPIVFRATRQWFIDIPKIQERMVEEVKRVSWTPEWAGSARQLDWVQNAREWCISRQRYWGIPLPVWECTSCDEWTVIGSRKELQQVSDWKGGDLHRPWIDRVRVVCPRHGCGGSMKRVADVLDVWFDSAVASWASLGFPGATEPMKSLFPAQWICEGLDQTRGWFYSQLAAGVASMDRVPYERVVMHGWVNDQHGRPMSKSLGNILQPKDVIAKMGADAFRFALVTGSAPWDDVSFGEDSVKSAQRTLNILWNVHVFATGYMAADSWRPGKVQESALTAEDRWLASRLQSTIADATRHFEAAEFHRAGREVERFVLEDLSRWYVRLVRERVWVEGKSADKDAAYATLHTALLTTARLLAPFTPHVAEALYQDLTAGKARHSVHMEDWPVADAAQTDYDLERDMAAVRAVVDAAAYARQKANMKLRWPVGKLVVATDDADVRSALTRFRATLLEQSNAKDVELVGGEWEKLDLVVLPNKAAIGKTLRQEGPRMISALASMPPDEVRELREAVRAGRPSTVAGLAVAPELVAGFETRLPAHTSGADFPGGSVYVETEVDEALKAEGAARDVTRRVQEMRKLLALPMAAFVRTEVAAPADFVAMVQPRVDEVKAATRSAALEFVDKPQGALVREWDLEGTTITIGVGEARATVAAKLRPKAKAKPATKPKPKVAAKAKKVIKRVVAKAKTAAKKPKTSAKKPKKAAPKPKKAAKKGKKR